MESKPVRMVEVVAHTGVVALEADCLVSSKHAHLVKHHSSVQQHFLEQSLLLAAAAADAQDNGLVEVMAVA
jgi:hypothetical protein